MGMMRAEIPPEVTSYEEKFFLGLTVRQLICVAVGFGLAIPTGIFGSKVLPSDIVQWAIVFETIPCAAIGWLKINDMHFEVYAKKMITFMIENQKRKFKYTSNLLSIQTEIREMVYKNDVAEKKERRKKKR